MTHEAVVVGSGPNGLAAAIVLARAGYRVLVREAADTPGGGVRTEALTLEGYLHDVCSSVYPLGAASPLFRALPLAEHGLAWIEPPVACAHPFDDGTAALLVRSTRDTAASLDREDATTWPALFDPFVARWEELFEEALAPLHVPEWPALLARFGVKALRGATGLATSAFEGPRAQALFAGLATHAISPISRAPTSAFALMMGVSAHAVGWPIARGGARRLTDALVSVLRASGGEVRTGAPVRALEELLPATGKGPIVLLDLSPRGVLEIAGRHLSESYRKALAAYRFGPGVFKVDWALSGPIPWRAPGCAEAGTLHLGGTVEEVEAAEQAPWDGRVAERPFLLVGQPSCFDPTRAPPGRHVAWAYCHVPNGSTVDCTAAIEAQVERFAPGFRDLVLARHVLAPADLERHNANLVGGDISGGAMTLGQTFFRPKISASPYETPIDGVWICSASTPPGGAVHGMCGFHAAKAALEKGRG